MECKKTLSQGQIMQSPASFRVVTVHPGAVIYFITLEKNIGKPRPHIVSIHFFLACLLHLILYDLGELNYKL